MKDAIVVGAGPAGLTAALAIRAAGRAVTVIEAGAADRVRPGSRAIFLHRMTLEILESLRPGLGREIVSHGRVFPTKRTFYRGREIYRQTYPLPGPDQLPAATNLPQVVTEQILLRHCRDAGVEFAWSTPIVAAETSVDRVTLTAESGSTFEARYVIGADGARSRLRESLGIRLEGPRVQNAYVIVDVKEDDAKPLPVERIFHYEHPAAGGRNVLFVPFAGHWRVDLQCNADDDPEQFSGEQGVRAWLPKVMDAKYADRITWVSTYVFHQAIATSFTDPHRRVLLGGEAAHLFAPFGARGLNSGIPDVVVAARAIDTALRDPGRARAAVDGFATNRRAAAARNRAASNAALAHLAVPTLGGRIVRRLAAALAPHVWTVARWMDKAPYGPQLGPPDADGMRY